MVKFQPWRCVTRPMHARHYSSLFGRVVLNMTEIVTNWYPKSVAIFEAEDTFSSRPINFWGYLRYLLYVEFPRCSGIPFPAYDGLGLTLELLEVGISDNWRLEGGLVLLQQKKTAAKKHRSEVGVCEGEFLKIFTSAYNLQGNMYY